MNENMEEDNLVSYNIHLASIAINQDIRANEEYIRYKTIEIEKLKAKIENQETELASLEAKYTALVTEKERNEQSTYVSSYCLKALSDNVVLLAHEKQEEEKRLSEWKDNFQNTLNEFSNIYNNLNAEYEKETPLYQELKEAKEENIKLETEVKLLRESIEEENRKDMLYKEEQKQQFYNSMVKFAETALTYIENKKMFKRLQQLEKEESRLLKEYSDLQRQETKKRFTSIAPKAPFHFQMPQFNVGLKTHQKENIYQEYGRQENLRSSSRRQNMEEILQNNPETQNMSKRLKVSPYFRQSQKEKNSTGFQDKDENMVGLTSKQTSMSEKRINIIDQKIFPPTCFLQNPKQKLTRNAIMKNLEGNQVTGNTSQQKQNSQLPQGIQNSFNHNGQIKTSQVKLLKNKDNVAEEFPQDIQDTFLNKNNNEQTRFSDNILAENKVRPLPQTRQTVSLVNSKRVHSQESPKCSQDKNIRQYQDILQNSQSRQSQNQLLTKQTRSQTNWNMEENVHYESTVADANQPTAASSPAPRYMNLYQKPHEPTSGFGKTANQLNDVARVDQPYAFSPDPSIDSRFMNTNKGMQGPSSEFGRSANQLNNADEESLQNMSFGNEGDYCFSPPVSFTADDNLNASAGEAVTTEEPQPKGFCFNFGQSSKSTVSQQNALFKMYH